MPWGAGSVFSLSKPGGWGAMPGGSSVNSAVSRCDAKGGQLFPPQCNTMGKGPGELAFSSACRSCPPRHGFALLSVRASAHSITLVASILSAPYTHPYGNILLSQSVSCSPWYLTLQFPGFTMASHNLLSPSPSCLASTLLSASSLPWHHYTVE